MARKEKRIKYYRGTRRCGRGNVKNRRGAGNRGGRGNAGLRKHKKTWMVKYAKDHFKRIGFVNPTRKEYDIINLYQIENMIEKGKLKEKEGKFVFEFEGKVLGTGEITKPVLIKALAWSKKAEEKIKNAGGEIIKLGSK